MRVRSIVVMAAAVALLSPAAGAAETPTEARLREALRAAQARVQALEAQVERCNAPAPAPAAAAPAPAVEGEALRRRVADLTARLRQAQAAGRVDLQGERQRVEAQAIAAAEERDKWREAYQTAAANAQARDRDRASLDARAESLGKRAEACEAKNARLYQVAREILDRLGAGRLRDAWLAREPFVGRKRVELENVAQDYEDKLLDQKVTP